MLGEVVPAFDSASAERNSFPRITAVATAALRHVIDAGVFDCAQVVTTIFSIRLPPRNCRQTIRHRIMDDRSHQGSRRWVVGIRVLAGGALSGSARRHPIASPAPEPVVRL